MQNGFLKKRKNMLRGVNKIMAERYRLIKQDTFKKLELGRIYWIEDYGNHKSIVNTNIEKYKIPLYALDTWQFENMFEKVGE